MHIQLRNSDSYTIQNEPGFGRSHAKWLLARGNPERRTAFFPITEMGFHAVVR